MTRAAFVWMVVAAVVVIVMELDRARLEGSRRGPPDLSSGYEVMWPSGRLADDGSLIPTDVWHFVMTADGRFTYRHLDVTRADTEWTQVEGAWHPVQGDDEHWTLIPDLGRDALEPNEYAPDRWPHVAWETFTLTVPALDPKTGRLGRAFSVCGDPRRPEPAQIRAMAEQALREAGRSVAPRTDRDEPQASK